MNGDLASVLASMGAPYGMSTTDMAVHLLLGERHHGDAPNKVCGAVDPRNEDRWCQLAPEHPGEYHNCYAPDDGCRTWAEHDGHTSTKRDD